MQQDGIGQGSWFQILRFNRSMSSKHIKIFNLELLFLPRVKRLKPAHKHLIHADLMAEMECSTDHL